jgi:hypothetical protein
LVCDSREGKLEVLDELWEWANEELAPKELSIYFLLAKYDTERTAWHVAATMGIVDVLKKLWEWAKKRLSTDEL